MDSLYMERSEHYLNHLGALEVRFLGALDGWMDGYCIFYLNLSALWNNF